MKIIFLFLAFISTAALAAIPSAVPSVTVSAPGANTGQVSISPSQLSGTGTNGIFSLYCTTPSPSTGDYYPCYLNGVAYKVGNFTGSGSPSAYCFDITAASTSAPQAFQLVSATASISGGGTSSLTGGVYQCGAAGQQCLVSGPSSNQPGVVPGVYTFSNNTYVGLQIGTTNTINLHMDCYEK